MNKELVKNYLTTRIQEYNSESEANKVLGEAGITLHVDRRSDYFAERLLDEYLGDANLSNRLYDWAFPIGVNKYKSFEEAWAGK